MPLEFRVDLTKEARFSRYLARRQISGRVQLVLTTNHTLPIPTEPNLIGQGISFYKSPYFPIHFSLGRLFMMLACALLRRVITKQTNPSVDSVLSLLIFLGNTLRP